MLDLIIKNGNPYIDSDLKKQDIAIKDNKIIDFALVYKRLDKLNNCNPYNRKYVAVVKKL